MSSGTRVRLRRADRSIEDGHDVAVVDPGCDARLVEEHRDELGIGGELGEQPLGDDEPAEALAADQAREVDRRHAAARDRAVQEISTDRDRLRVWLGGRHYRVLLAHVMRPHSKN
ncbi:MAG: hypothetical protein E6J90_35495 [Deltaproteobacteria bacterium]|nr:MAG: hypothetical protein E6J90_35495 [Deltaproteobacteria bacterium]